MHWSSLALVVAALGCRHRAPVSEPPTRPWPVAHWTAPPQARPQVTVNATNATQESPPATLPSDASKAAPQVAPPNPSSSPNGSPPSAPPNPPSSDTGAPPTPTPPADPVQAAREQDEIAFENDYLRQKERLFPDHVGQWIAIANGRLVPADERGKPQPTTTFDLCVKALDSAAPTALHRFVFRIGEEGDVIYVDSAAQPRNVVGTSLRATLGVTASFDAKTSTIAWTRGDKSHHFALDHESMELLLADATGKQQMGARVSDSNSFGGFVAIEPTVGALLDTHRFEIPGRALLKSAAGLSELRRARVRVAVPELGVDELVPAAVWPTPTPPPPSETKPAVPETPPAH